MTIRRYLDGFVNVNEPYDAKHHASRYHFTQCPNAAFAKSHGMLHVQPILCNCDFFGIGKILGQLIRCGTCGNSDKCDYLAVGSENSIAAEYETITDELGFLVSKQRTWRCRQEKCHFCIRPTRKHGTKVMTQVSALRQREPSPCRTSQR